MLARPLHGCVSSYQIEQFVDECNLAFNARFHVVYVRDAVEMRGVASVLILDYLALGRRLVRADRYQTMLPDLVYGFA